MRGTAHRHIVRSRGLPGVLGREHGAWGSREGRDHTQRALSDLRHDSMVGARDPAAFTMET